MQRQYDLERVAGRYRYHAPYGPDICVYCGDWASGIDHVAPLSYVVSVLDIVEAQTQRFRSALLTVPACKDCNGRLGGFVAFSVTEKRAELKRRLRYRHRRILGEYDWDDEEIADLGYSLQGFIRKHEAQRAKILSRLRFPEPGEATVLRVAAEWH